jgi:glycosyltransferase involved in cell wall biosynthesis
VRVLVIVPFRGSEIELKECVDSIRRSDHAEFRILVFDDRDIFKNRPIFLTTDEYVFTGGIGLPAVIALSKSLVTEEYVALIAGDDLMSENRLTLQLKEILKSKTEICLGQMKKFSSGHKEIESLIGKPTIKKFTKVWLLLGAYGADGTIFMTKKFYFDKYLLDPTDSYSDWATALRNYPPNVAYVSQDLVYYRQHQGQTTRNARNDFLSSSVFAEWQSLFDQLFHAKPSQNIFLIISAPWYRSKIPKSELKESVLYFNMILEYFNTHDFDSEERNSLERVIIRRLIFRVNLHNFITVLICLKKLNAGKYMSKSVSESFVIIYSLLRFKGIRPRRVIADLND